MNLQLIDDNLIARMALVDVVESVNHPMSEGGGFSRNTTMTYLGGLSAQIKHLQNWNVPVIKPKPPIGRR